MNQVVVAAIEGDKVAEVARMLGAGEFNAAGREMLFGRLYLGVGVRSGSVGVVRLLLDSGAQGLINTVDVGGNTALHDAVLANNAAMVELLLEKEADVNVLSRGGFEMRGQLPLEMARGAVREMLVRAGALPYANFVVLDGARAQAVAINSSMRVGVS